MKHFVLVFLCLFSFFTKAQTQYKSLHFTTDEGLPSNIIYSITEDKKGTIVIGTDNGLSVFNGNEFENYNVKNGLINPYIVSVYNDNNSILMLNYNGKLQKFENNKIVTTNIFTEVNNQILTTKNTIYLYTIQNRNKNNTYVFTAIDKKSLVSKKSVSTSEYNRIAPPILTQNQESITLEDDLLHYKNYKIKLPNEIRLIHKVVFRKNDVCILEDDYLYVLDFKSELKSKIKLPTNLSKNPVYKYDFILDQFENCWLSIQNQGLFILKNNNWIPLSESIGLNKEDNINYLFCDSTGKIWIATNEKGLFCIPTTLNETLIFKNEGNFFNSFATSLDENLLYFSSKFRLYSLNKNSDIKLLEKSDFEIHLDNYDKQPFLFSSKDKPEFWSKKFNLYSFHGRQILKHDKEYILLYGTTNLCTAKVKNNKVEYNFITYKNPKKEKTKGIVLHKNEYYFNNGQEIDIRTFDSKFISIKRKLKFKINGYIEDFAFVNDTMWIAANNAIYKVYNEKIVDSILEINNVRLDNVRKIKPIGSDIFLCAGNGLFKINKSGKFVCNKFNFLPSNDVYNVIVFDHNLFVATNNGLAKINQEILNTKTKKPSFEILYNEKAIAKIALKSNQKFASIRLKIKNFNAVENQIIQYKYDDSNWLKTRNKGINFQSVSYGDHKITIRIKDVNSDWKIKTFEICRAYPFYLKWWFFVLVALVLISILTLIYRNQIDKINKKKQQEIATNNQIIELRQNALSAMMNPHFIFNSLSAGQYFINSNQQEKSSEHIGKLARLVRLFLSQSSASFISIADEIKRLQLYVELEQVRFNNFQFELQVDQKINVLETKIPNMIVQPFIENAILHGISNPKINDGKIELKIALNDTIITIEIIDNGFGFDESKSKNDNHISKGISIIEERLSILQKSNPTKVFSITQDFAFLNSERKGHKVVVKTTILD